MGDSVLDIQSRLASLHATELSRKKQPELPPIYTADLETDPFAYNQMIAPFAAGFYDGSNFQLFWEGNCVKRFFTMLETKPAGIIYIHNFGGFDFFWMLPYFTGSTLVRNGRIVCTNCKARDGKLHEIRDSYAIMPFALKQYIGADGKKVKLDIDMSKLTQEKRTKYKDEIVKYLKRDCTGLHDLVTRFLERFGNKLTVGSAAMNELSKLHTFIKIESPSDDKEIRKQFYYGGRVQCFQSGVIRGDFKVYDVNSMYPYVMKHYRHPIGRLESITPKITKDTAFIVAEGRNHNAFPQRSRDGSLRFDVEEGIFSMTIHEWNVAKRYSLFDCRRILAAYNFKLQSSFALFVDKFYELRKKAKSDKDNALALFYKYILNSSCGKFAQDSSQYHDYQITDDQTNLLPPEPCEQCRVDLCAEHWKVDTIYSEFHLIMWRKLNPKPVFYNVATGCSITGAARSVLLEAYANAKNPVYCDTDSLICEGLSGVQFSESELGAWKEEATGDTVAIAGKKLYAVFKRGKVIKQANKGCRITAKEIRFLAQSSDHEIEYQRAAPSLGVDGKYKFLKRRIRKTV